MMYFPSKRGNFMMPFVPAGFRAHLGQKLGAIRNVAKRVECLLLVGLGSNVLSVTDNSGREVTTHVIAPVDCRFIRAGNSSTRTRAGSVGRQTFHPPKVVNSTGNRVAICCLTGLVGAYVAFDLVFLAPAALKSFFIDFMAHVMEELDCVWGVRLDESKYDVFDRAVDCENRADRACLGYPLEVFDNVARRE